MTIECPIWDKDGWAASEDYIRYCVRLLIDCLDLQGDGGVLDLGCGRGTITAALADTLPVSVPVEAVDPSPTVLDQQANSRISVSCSGALEYLEQRADRVYGGIIMKQMFHLIEPQLQPIVLKHAYRTLRPASKALILTMPPVPTMPIFPRFEETFAEGQILVDDVVELGSEQGFQTSVSECSYPVRLSKAAYFNLIRSRFLSNLHTLTDAEIEEGLKILEKRFAGNDEIEFDDKLFVIHLVRPEVEEDSSSLFE